MSAVAIRVSLLVNAFERRLFFSHVDDRVVIVSFLVLDTYIEISTNMSHDLEPPQERRLRPAFGVGLLRSVP